MSLTGKVALITGAGSGIGRAVAGMLGSHGATIAGADWNADAVQSVAAELRATKITAEAFRVDVSKSQAVDRLVEDVVGKFSQIDILVHCAGTAPHGPVVEMTDEAWHRGLSVNLDGVFFVSRAVGREMLKRRSGTMVFMASDRGLYGGAKLANYAAAKGGVIAFVKSLALELASSGITVNTINPGTTDTPLARGNMSDEQWKAKTASDPLGRFSQPEEIAEIVRFLSETAGSFMTGQLITTRMRTG